MDFYNRKITNHPPCLACKPQGPQHTYYYIVVIIVTGKKMQEREMRYTFNYLIGTPNEESHPVTDPLGKTVEETGDKLITT